MFRETLSSDDGTYFVSGIVPGVYEITAQLAGFKKHSSRDVRLEIGKTSSIDISLQVGAVEEIVNGLRRVTDRRHYFERSRRHGHGARTGGAAVDQPQLRRASSASFRASFRRSAPSRSAATRSPSTARIPRNNNYMLDGANNNDDVIGQRAGTQARTPIEAVQEFQVITNQFDAEFGRTTGAIINAVTKQGTNRCAREWSSSSSQDAALTAKNYFAKKNQLPKPDTSQQQFGGTFGGPIVRDKAHFFAASNAS